MEPSIQRTTSADGTTIAAWRIGEGPTLVHMPFFPLSNFQMEWQNDSARAWYEGLSRGRSVLRYDCRGAGQSDRDVSDYSLETQIADIEAVVEQFHIESFALLAFVHSGPAAIAYAARYPERVSQLILYCSYADAVDYVRAPRVEAARSLVERDFDLYAAMEGVRATDWEGGETAQWYTAYIRASVSPAGLQQAFEALRGYNVRELLPLVKAPTLVLHRRDLRTITIDVARELASSIPNAGLVMLEGPWLIPYLGDMEFLLNAIRTFLDETTPASLPDGLTPREVEVLRLIASGHSNREIAAALELSERTVARHITNVYGKIDAHSKADATSYAIRNKLA